MHSIENRSEPASEAWAMTRASSGYSYGHTAPHRTEGDDVVAVTHPAPGVHMSGRRLLLASTSTLKVSPASSLSRNSLCGSPSCLHRTCHLPLLRGRMLAILVPSQVVGVARR
jgi:hypothetical protein